MMSAVLFAHADGFRRRFVDDRNRISHLADLARLRLDQRVGRPNPYQFGEQAVFASRDGIDGSRRHPGLGGDFIDLGGEIAVRRE